jgi:hypothetical protein
VGGAVFEVKLLEGIFADITGGFLGGVAEENPLQVRRIDGAFLNHGIPEHFNHRRPVALSHQDEGEMLHFSRLDQGRHLEKLVRGAEPAWHGDKGVGILGQH